jgi:hypothetical protein
MNWVIIILILIASIIIIIYSFLNEKKADRMSFKEALDLTDLPIITFYQVKEDNSINKFNFLLDTGANLNVINKNSLPLINYKDTENTNTVFGMEGQEQNVKVVSIDCVYKDKKYIDTFQVIDMSNAFDIIKKESGVTLHGIIGNNFMQKYKYVLDFNEFVAYSKQ